MPDLFFIALMAWVIPGAIGWLLLEDADLTPWWALARMTLLVFCVLGPFGLIIGGAIVYTRKRQT